DLGIRTVGEWSLGADEELIHPPAETESPPGPEQPWEARSTEPQVVLPQVQQLA
ncbi:unnamed protein product, partial [Penicillium egyptiacum]